jgi:hypothetical protein
MTQVVCCPGGVVTGYTRFLPNEEQLESQVVTRAYMEAQMVVALAGRHPPSLPWSGHNYHGKWSSLHQGSSFSVSPSWGDSPASNTLHLRKQGTRDGETEASFTVSPSSEIAPHQTHCRLGDNVDGPRPIDCAELPRLCSSIPRRQG